MLMKSVVIFVAAAFFGGAVPTQTAQARDYYGDDDIWDLMNPSWWADEFFDDDETKAWFYAALAAAVRPDSDEQQQAFVDHLDSPNRVVLEVVPSVRIGFDGDSMFRGSAAGPSCSRRPRSRDSKASWRSDSGRPTCPASARRPQLLRSHRHALGADDRRRRQLRRCDQPALRGDRVRR